MLRIPTLLDLDEISSIKSRGFDAGGVSAMVRLTPTRSLLGTRSPSISSWLWIIQLENLGWTDRNEKIHQCLKIPSGHNFMCTLSLTWRLTRRGSKESSEPGRRLHLCTIYPSHCCYILYRKDDISVTPVQGRRKLPFLFALAKPRSHYRSPAKVLRWGRQVLATKTRRCRTSANGCVMSVRAPLLSSYFPLSGTTIILFLSSPSCLSHLMNFVR